MGNEKWAGSLGQNAVVPRIGRREERGSGIGLLELDFKTNVVRNVN